MKGFHVLIFAALLLLSSCYGNPAQEDENISNELKTDSGLIPVDSAERDHTETNKSDTLPGKSGRVNGM